MSWGGEAGSGEAGLEQGETEVVVTREVTEDMPDK